MILVMGILIAALSLIACKQRFEIDNLKVQIFKFEMTRDLESRGGIISEEYSMEVPPPIPRILQ